MMSISVDVSKYWQRQSAIVDVEFCVGDGIECTSTVLQNVRKWPSLINDRFVVNYRYPPGRLDTSTSRRKFTRLKCATRTGPIQDYEVKLKHRDFQLLPNTPTTLSCLTSIRYMRFLVNHECLSVCLTLRGSQNFPMSAFWGFRHLYCSLWKPGFVLVERCIPFMSFCSILQGPVSIYLLNRRS